MARLLLFDVLLDSTKFNQLGDSQRVDTHYDIIRESQLTYERAYKRPWTFLYLFKSLTFLTVYPYIGQTTHKDISLN